MTTYVGRPESADWQQVGDVFVVDKQGQRKLDPRYDQVNHSPTGFAWGYGGSGPAQLAFAILADAKNTSAAMRHYQHYKREFIAKLENGAWQIEATDVREWLEIQEAKI